MKKHIVCLGDSNTHGYCADPSDGADGQMIRFNEDERWTCLLQKALGEDYLVIEEGLSGRTTVFEDPVEEGLPALPWMYPCLKSHKPVSLLIMMLGTNDAKARLGASAHDICRGMRRLVHKARTVECWLPPHCSNILIIAPPPMGQGVYTGIHGAEMGPGSAEKTAQLAALYEAMAREEHVAFLDAGAVGCTFNKVDHMHLNKAGHARLAEVLAELVPTLVKEN